MTSEDLGQRWPPQIVGREAKEKKKKRSTLVLHFLLVCNAYNFTN